MTDPTRHEPAIRVWMMPRDANAWGTIFGGVILSYIDQAGAIEALRHTEERLVTAGLHEVKFIAPVFVGDLVSFYAEVTETGNTSMTVCVTVEARRALAPHDTVRGTQAEWAYAAMDGAARPGP